MHKSAHWVWAHSLAFHDSSLSISIERFICESLHCVYINSIIQSTPSPAPQSDTGLFCGYCTEDRSNQRQLPFIQRRLLYTVYGRMSIVTTNEVYDDG